MESSQELNKSVGGRPKSGIQIFFEYDDVLKKAKCTITGCLYSCHKHTGNQTRHMSSVHPEIYRRFLTEHQNESSKQASNNELLKKSELQVLNRVNLSRSTLKRAILELVTVNGRPFSIFEDSGMRMILHPLLECLPQNEKLSTSPENIKLYVYDEADRIKKIIAQEVKEKTLISLKVDVASRHGRSFLGVNIQFITNGKITIRTLGVVEITEKHTSEHLKNVLIKVFKIYDMTMKNVFSFTSDNAANMIKLHDLLETIEDVDSEESKTIDDTESECDVIMIEDNNEMPNMENMEEDHVNDHANVEDNVIESLNDCFRDENYLKIANIRCAAHTLQLAIDDGIKVSNVNKLIAKARMAVKYFRKDSVMNNLRKLRPKLSKPVLDVVTRWHSTHDMLASLLDFKDFGAHTKFLSEKDWEDVAMYVEVLKPAKIAAKKFQDEQLIMPEFYSAWLFCKEAVLKVNVPFAHNIVKSMEKREQKIVENNVVLAAIFLDPLLNCLLTEEKRKTAMDYLVELWIKLQNSIIINEQADKSTNISIQPDEEDSNISEQISTMATVIREALHKKKKAKMEKPSTIDIMPIVQRFYENAERSEEENLLKFWERNKFVHPELYKIATIILATPATQVSVERLFSGLKYIFSDLRGKLNTDILNAVMIVRTNHKDLCTDENEIITKKKSKRNKFIAENSSRTSSECSSNE